MLAIAEVSIFLQLYKYHYNKGNEYYDSYKYSDAAAEYNKALSYPVPDGEECAIKVNLVLAKIAPVNFDNVPEADLSDTIDLLGDCIDLLCEDGCAHKMMRTVMTVQPRSLRMSWNRFLRSLRSSRSRARVDRTVTKIRTTPVTRPRRIPSRVKVRPPLSRILLRSR